MNRFLNNLIIVAGIVLIYNSAPAQTCPVCNDLPIAIEGHALAAPPSYLTSNPEVFIFGGLSGSTTLDAVYMNDVGGWGKCPGERYSWPPDPWTLVATIPTGARRNASAVFSTVTNKIYLIGGQNTAGTLLNSVLEFDPVTYTWTTKASMPVARHSFGAVEADGKIYVAGGMGLISPTNVLQSYDPLTNTWTTLAPMPGNRQALELAAARDAASAMQLFAMGGMSSPVTYTSTNFKYNIAANTWTIVAPMPYNAAYFISHYSPESQYIHIYYGKNAGGIINQFAWYYPLTNVWYSTGTFECDAPISSARSNSEGFSFEGSSERFAWAIGGNDGTSSSLKVTTLSSVIVLDEAQITLQGKLVSANVSLDWQIAGVHSVQTFRIEEDAASSGHFTPLMEVKCNGVCCDNNYNKSFENSRAGGTTYRIRAILADGSQLLSNVVHLTGTAPADEIQIRHDKESLQIYGGSSFSTSIVNIEVMDLTGKMILTSEKPAGSADCTLNLNATSQGIYLLRLTWSGRTVVKKVLW